MNSVNVSSRGQEASLHSCCRIQVITDCLVCFFERLVRLIELTVFFLEPSLKIDHAFPCRKPDQKFIFMNRLFDIIVGAALHTLDQIRPGAPTGTNDSVNIAAKSGGPNLMNQLETAHSWHHPVREYNVETISLEFLPGGVSVGNGDDVVPVPGQHRNQYEPLHRIIF